MSLISIKVLVKKFPLAVRAQDQVTWAKMASTYPTNDITHKKNPELFSMQTRKLATSFQHLNNSAQSVDELRWCKMTVKKVVHTGLKVKTNSEPRC